MTSWDQRWHLWSHLLEATWACILFLTQTCLLFSANLEKNVNFAIIISLLLWLYTTFQLGETGFCLTASDPKVYFNHKQNHNERLSVFCGGTRMLRGECWGCTTCSWRSPQAPSFGVRTFSQKQLSSSAKDGKSTTGGVLQQRESQGQEIVYLEARI